MVPNQDRGHSIKQLKVISKIKHLLNQNQIILERKSKAIRTAGLNLKR
jgi:hypothetical protein